jgi:hypothetical protein
VLLDSNELVAYRGQAKADFGGQKTLWKIFVFLIDQKPRREWRAVATEVGSTNFRGNGRTAYCRIDKIIAPLGLRVDRARGKTGACIAELEPAPADGPAGGRRR